MPLSETMHQARHLFIAQIGKICPPDRTIKREAQVGGQRVWRRGRWPLHPPALVRHADDGAEPGRCYDRLTREATSKY